MPLCQHNVKHQSPTESKGLFVVGQTQSYTYVGQLNEKALARPEHLRPLLC